LWVSLVFALLLAATKAAIVATDRRNRPTRN
jgi:hypothetical protein